MGEKTGIAWTDSTYNSFWGCTKVSPACDHCYAEAVDKRGPGGNHWGPGVPRRLLSESARNEPYRWQKKADAFEAEHGRPRRVFTLSMGDLFDNEVPTQWRADHMETMADCDRLRWQICTKRIGNLPKMILPYWEYSWPQHIGVLITVINQAEAERDIPKLLRAKRIFNIPWVGVSYEPAIEEVDFVSFVEGTAHGGVSIDWVICGGESGAGWRPMDLDWARTVRDQCAWTETAFFFKQVAAFRPKDDMIPDDLRIRDFPEALNR